MIDYIDNVFDQFSYNAIVEYCLSSPYFFGETDNPSTPPCGMVSDFDPQSEICAMMNNHVYNVVPSIRNLNLYASYINLFTPSENPRFHTDCEIGITCLYYIGLIETRVQQWRQLEYHPNEGGETQFLQGESSINILPIANRLAFFDANILHRATSFRNHYRFTIALKYR